MSLPLDVAHAYLDALGGDDPDAVAAHVVDDFRNEHQSEIGSGCVGRDAYLARRLKDLPDEELDTLARASAILDRLLEAPEEAAR